MAEIWDIEVFDTTPHYQMNLEGEFFDSIKMTGKEGIKHSLLLSAHSEFLKVISPCDAGALTSFEKFSQELAMLEGAIEVPLILGCLSPISALSEPVRELVYGPRLQGD